MSECLVPNKTVFELLAVFLALQDTAKREKYTVR